MNKITKTYNLLMEGFNSQQKAVWEQKLKQYPQFCNVDDEIWDKYVSCWSAQNWQYEDKQIEVLTEDQMWNLWNKFMSSPTNYIMFFMGITEPQRVEELYYQVRDQMAQEEQEEHYKHTVNESCFDDGTYDELYEWYDQDLVSAVLDMLSHNDLFYPPRTVARRLEDKDILEVYKEGKLRDLTKDYINWKINPRYYSSYGLKKYVTEAVDLLDVKYEEMYMDTLKKRLKEYNIRLQGIPVQAICDQFQEAYHSVSLDKLQRMSEKEFRYIVKEIIHMFKQHKWMLTKYF